jgi:hypothetical protein
VLQALTYQPTGAVVAAVGLINAAWSIEVSSHRVWSG